jgi:hypothetical protein
MSKSVFPTFAVFLSRQAPKLMALVTLPAVIEMLLSNQAPKVLALFLTGFLLYSYLKEEGKVYLVGEIKNQFSPINLEHASDENLSKDWQFYIFLTALYVTVILALITYNIHL